MRDSYPTIKTATIADLRNHFPNVYRWIEEGEAVNLTKWGKIVAQLVPPPVEVPRRTGKVDFEAIQRKVFGENYRERTLATNFVLEEREG